MTADAMEQTNPSLSPRCRWWRSRKLMYLGALVLLLAGSYWLHDWFFMPEDLRRIQGSWVIVKATDGRGEIAPIPAPARREILTFKGRTAFRPGRPNDLFPFEVSDGKFFLCDPDNTHTILGFQVRLPAWLSRAKGVIFGTYEFKDNQLILCLIGEMDPANDRAQERAQQIIYLERQPDHSE